MKKPTYHGMVAFKVDFTLRRTPETAGRPGRILVLEINPARTRPHLSVQPDCNLGRGIIRGLRENGRLIEDHTVDPYGRRRCGDDAMRAGIWTVERHQAAHSDVVAVTGNGNLLANPHFIAWQDGVLYHLAGEPLARRHYTCLVARGGDVSIEPFTTDCRFATFGQQIVRDGNPISREDLIAKVLAGEFYDLRHLFLFPRMHIAGDRWIDPGLDSLDVAAALRGEPVTTDVSDFDEALLRQALALKGYEQYDLRSGRLTWLPQPGIYPHHLVGIRSDGTMLAVLIDGLSNRVGVSIPEAAGLMIGLGARDALILDNGRDVMLRHCGRAVLEGRPRMLSVLLFRSPSGDAGRLISLEA